MIDGKEVPQDYNDLYRTFGVDIPQKYQLWGYERFEIGGREYARETEYGVVNACWLPTTDTVKEFEEEILDSYFNALVLRWRNPKSTFFQWLVEKTAEILNEIATVEAEGDDVRRARGSN